VTAGLGQSAGAAQSSAALCHDRMCARARLSARQHGDMRAAYCLNLHDSRNTMACRFAASRDRKRQTFCCKHSCHANAPPHAAGTVTDTGAVALGLWHRRCDVTLRTPSPTTTTSARAAFRCPSLPKNCTLRVNCSSNTSSPSYSATLCGAPSPVTPGRPAGGLPVRSAVRSGCWGTGGQAWRGNGVVSWLSDRT